ncbi:MAG: lipid-A-disaccharide synthase, partial [Thermodesulfobacteriota bacterium]|nr:lipid-A-disaccharide synthase [Thermodesulfobacteriota bacterium]
RPDPARIGILPGSRDKEIRALMPEFVRAARILHARRPELTFAVARAPGVSKETISQFLPLDFPMKVEPPQGRYRLMRESAFLLAASGTVALEAAFLGTPAIVAYRLSGLTYFLGRIFVHVPHISLPNLILKERVFPELLQAQANAEVIVDHALAWLENESEIVRVRRKLVALKELMGEPGAPRRAAQIILDLLR